MKTTIIYLYLFNELSEEAQAKAIENLYDLNVDHSWWDFVYEDAENIDFKINGFDHCVANGNFVNTPQETVNAIIENHGEHCPTYKLAKTFLEDFDKAEFFIKMFYDLWVKYDVDHMHDMVMKYNRVCDELIAQFRNDLSGEYLRMLNEEYDYRTSKEAIKETIELNDYYFDKDGNLDNS